MRLASRCVRVEDSMCFMPSAGTPPRVRPARKTNACTVAFVFVSAAAGADHPHRLSPHHSSSLR